MNPRLYYYQAEAVEKLRTGSILYGGVGSGKSITSMAYYYTKVCDGKMDDRGRLTKPKKMIPLFIITTARKRDTKEWEKEYALFGLKKDIVTVDSWNNIGKYSHVSGAFFIFDEQRVIGYGAWARTFLKIAAKNDWILLSATPGDTWSDYIPVFVANGFYKNKSDFLRQHAVYSRIFTHYPKIDRYIGIERLEALRNKILVRMDYNHAVEKHEKIIQTEYCRDLYKTVLRKRWDIFDDKPITAAAEACYLLRKIVNLDESKMEAIDSIIRQHPRVIIFYNYDYELNLLREHLLYMPTAEWNGHKHELIPSGDSWAYFVQYAAGSEGWNCISTDTIIFLSQSYSYKQMMQAAGRIDRINSPYHDLYYYTLISDSPIDKGITRALSNKKDFNERAFLGKIFHDSTSRKKHALL